MHSDKRYQQKFRQSLKKAYPLAHHLLEGKQWDEMVDQFLAEPRCTSPYFWKVPECFLHFVKEKQFAEQYAIPYLDDLLDFEWLEIEMYMMPDQRGKEERIVVYSYPIFEKKPLPRPMKKGSYPLYAFRHPESKEIRFIGLTPFYCKVLELMDEMPGEEALAKAAEAFKIDPTKVLVKGREFINALK